MIIYRQKSEPNTSPLEDLVLNLQKLIDVRGPLRRKGWAMLLLGCFHLMKIRGPGWKDKLQSATAHLYTFSLRYRSRLAKEVVFLLFWPVWVSSHLYPHMQKTIEKLERNLNIRK
jgi:hypothetical protein